MPLLETVALAVLVGASAFLSASEVALFSLTRFQLRHLKETHKSLYRRVKNLISNPSGLLITILAANEIINVSIATILTNFLASRSEAVTPTWAAAIPTPIYQLLAGTALTLPVILFLCEVTPKTIGVRANVLISQVGATPLNGVYWLFTPLRKMLQAFVSMLLRPFGASDKTSSFLAASAKDEFLLKEEDFLTLVEEGHKAGAIHESELDLIRNLLELDQTTVADIMTPFKELRTLPSHSTVAEALGSFQKWKQSRIAITQGKEQKIEGVLYLKDILSAHLDVSLMGEPVSQWMRKPFTVLATMRIQTVFRFLKKNQIHYAVVEDDAGKSIGTVTMYDIMDALFEDLFEEEEPTTPPALAPPVEKKA